MAPFCQELCLRAVTESAVWRWGLPVGCLLILVAEQGPRKERDNKVMFMLMNCYIV